MEKLEQEIISYLSQAKDFLLSEMPSFFQEALNYWFLENFIYLLIMLCLNILWIYLFKKFLTTETVMDPDLEEGLWVAFATTLIVLFICNIFTVSSMNDCLKIRYAPKLYIYEKFIGGK